MMEFNFFGATIGQGKLLNLLVQPWEEICDEGKLNVA